MVKVGAVYIWSYVYFMMRIYQVENTSNIDTDTCAESGTDYTQLLLPSTDINAHLISPTVSLISYISIILLFYILKNKSFLLI